MPCNDVTEILKLTIDNADRIVEYSLHKLTCGGTVTGQSLIRPWVKLKTVDETLAINQEDVLASLIDDGKTDEFDEFLHLKHLFSIQSALRMLTGEMSGTVGQMCVINSLEQDEKGTRLIAELNLSLLTDEIKACGRAG